MKINLKILNPALHKNKIVTNPQSQAPLSLRRGVGGEVKTNNMKCFSILVTLILLSSCSNSFINHKLQSEKIGACTNEAVPIKMLSNINGERYEFQYCLNDGFDGKNYTIERNGDSLLIKFPATTAKTALYKLTLDIDAKPAYHHIKLGDQQTIEVVPTDKF